MSRIGRLPVVIPAGVEVTVSPENLVTVKGPKGTLTLAVNKEIKVEIADNQVHVSRPNDELQMKAMHGLYRKLIFNMVEGVTQGYKKSLTVNGVGYKVVKQGNKLVIDVGYSHTVDVVEEDGIKLECPTPTDITVSGIDKAKVGQVAANIRSIRLPDPYHAYGIAYADEVIQRKEGKKAGK